MQYLGETIRIGRTVHLLANACLAIARHFHYLCWNGASPVTPLCVHLVNGWWCVITTSQVTAILRAAVSLNGPSFGLQPHYVSAQSLRSSRALAMMCGGIDTARGRLQLQGRWLSNVMFRWLSVQHAPLCANIGQCMVAGSNFDTVPSPVPADTPAASAFLLPADDVPALAAIIAHRIS